MYLGKKVTLILIEISENLQLSNCNNCTYNYLFCNYQIVITVQLFVLQLLNFLLLPLAGGSWVTQDLMGFVNLYTG